MAGGKDQKDANKMLKAQGETQAKREDSFNTRNQSDLDASRKKGDDLYSGIKSGYESLINPAQAAASGGGGGGGGGPAPDSRFADVESMYRNNMSKEGGWDPDRLKRSTDDISKLRGLGYDPETVNRMRGGGVFDEFSKTGGLSEGDRSNLRQRGNSTIPAMYDSLRNEGNRMSAIQGGYGPGRQAMQSRMARQQGAGMQDAALNTELGITSQVNEGRKWGAAGMASNEGALSSLRQGSLSNAIGAEGDIQSSINANQKWGTQGLEARAESDRSAAASAAASGSANDKWAQEFAYQQKMAGLGGLESLYGSSPEEYMANKGMDMSNRNVGGNQVGNQAQALKTGNKSWTDYAAPIAGAVAGGMTGGLSTVVGGAMKKGGKPAPNYGDQNYGY